MIRKKIAIFIPFGYSDSTNSGVARLEMFKYLDYLTDIYHFNQAEFVNGKPVTFSFGSYRPRSTWKNLMRLPVAWRLFTRNNKKFSYQIIWATSPPIIAAFFAAIFRHFLNIPLVVDVRDPYISSVVLVSPPSTLTFKLAKKMEKYVYKQADHVCVTTEQSKELISSLYGVDKQKITVISNATVGKTINNLPLSEPLTVFYAGGFASYQVMDKVIENILKNRQGQKNNINFYFYGYSQTEQPELAKQISHANAADWLKLFPPIPRSQVFQKMADCHIALVPISGLGYPELYDYAVPLKYYEALSVSKPILLYGGTAASIDLINKDKVGAVCRHSQNIFFVLDKLAKNYYIYRAQANIARYTRRHEANKLRKIFSGLIGR